MRRRARDGLHRVLGAIDALHAADGSQTVGDFRAAVDAPRLLEAAATWREYERLEERGQLDAMLARYGTLRQYLPGFLALPFQAAAGSEALLRAIELGRALDDGERAALAPDDPSNFVPAAWRPFLIEDGKVERRIWEIALALARARRAARRQSVPEPQPQPRLVLEPDPRRAQLAEHRDEAYRKLDLPTDARAFLEGIAAALDRGGEGRCGGLAAQPLRQSRERPDQAQATGRDAGPAGAAALARHDPSQPAAGAHRGPVAGC